jgi:bifunctional polynucleotide phosphatase/kinase
MITDWIDKIKAIGQQLQFHFIFVSIRDDRYRKPLPDSWEYIKTNLLNGINLDNIVRKKKIYYIGDACGRQTDFSDTDFKFAYNCGFKFKTPEMFFKFDLSKPNIKNCSITYPEIPSFTLNEHELFLTNIFNLIESNKNKKIFIMMIGFPGSGKSFLRKEIVKKYTGFKYINNDDSYNKIIDSHLITKNNSYNYIIEDNTNLNLNTRTKLLNEFDSYYKIAIWFDYSMDVIKHLNLVRMYWFGGTLISPIVYRTMNKSFVKPEFTEGFDKLITINNVFFNFNDTIKYYF